MKTQNIAQRSFLFYMGIFLLMILFESQRFSTYFERESSKRPQLSLVSERIEDIAEFTKIGMLTQNIGQVAKDFSKEYIINDDSPMHEQLMGFVDQYMHYDFSKIGKWETQNRSNNASNNSVDNSDNSSNADNFANSDSSNFDSDSRGIKKLAENNRQSPTENDTKNIKEQGKNKNSSSSLNASQGSSQALSSASQASSKDSSSASLTEGKKTSVNGSGSKSASTFESNGTVKPTSASESTSSSESFSEPASESTAKSTSKPESDSELIQRALLDKDMTVAMLVQQKQASAQDTPNVQDAQNVQERQVDSQDNFSFDFMGFSKKEQDNPYYNPKNSSPAPSKLAIREYKSNLPDYGKKNKVLIVGDSMMMEGLGPTLHASLRKRTDLSVIREGRYSSGLSRPDFYNWPENLSRLINKHDPQLIIVSMGANDTQDIVINKKRHFIDTKSWERVYGIRTYKYLNIAAAENRQVLWVSLPVMGLEPYFTRTKRISKIQAEVSAYFDNVQYINIEKLLTKNGKFVSFIKEKGNKSTRLRQKDLIHVSQEGGKILTNFVLPQVQENIDNIRYKEVAGNIMPPVSGEANHVAFTSELRKKETEYIIYLPKEALKTTKSEEAKEPQKDILIDSSVDSPINIEIKTQGKTAIEKELQTNPETKINTKTGTSAGTKVDTEIAKARAKAPFIPNLIKETMKSGEERFPVLYLLHGAYDSGEVWNKTMGKELQKIADEKRVIIVAPSAEPFGWYLDSPLVTQNQIESFLIKELVPHIDMLYPTNKKRAVAGLSMGGHGAMLLGFKYPKVFMSVASASGVLDIRLHPDQWKIKELLGNITENKASWNENSVLAHIGKKWKKYAPAQILIVTGTEDKLVLEDNRLAKDLLEKRKFDFEYEEITGNHDWAFWMKNIPNQLRKQADFLHGIQ